MADSPFEAVATAIIAVFNAEFTAEQYQMVPDDLHEAMGQTRVVAGISPIEDVTKADNAVVQETWVEVKFYDLWTKKVDPSLQVNPYRIAKFAERFRNALRVANAMDPGTGQVWFFDVRRVRYPRDPTGNKTRFVMDIRAMGNNAALVETIA